MYSHLSKNSIYHEKLVRKGIRLIEGRSLTILSELKTKDVMSNEVLTISSNTTINDAMKCMSGSGHTGLLVVGENNDLVGIVTNQDVRKSIENGNSNVFVNEVMSKDLIYTYPDESLSEVIEKFLLRDIGRLPVVSPLNYKKILGTVTRTDILNGYYNMLNKE